MKTQPPRYSASRLKRLSQLERWHFWFVGRRTLITRLVRKHFIRQTKTLDVGCGTGFTAETLMALGYRVVALDLHHQGLHALHQVRPNALLLQGEAAWLPLKANAFGAAVLLDLIEHVDDRGVLREIQRVLRPGGVALITVPAMPWLWSYRDDVSGHLRRYTRSQLYNVIKDSRLEVCEIRHYQFILLPFIILTRLLGRKSGDMCNLEERPLPVINSALTWINQIETILGDFIAWPCGSSLVAVCRKT